jgi:glycosyltransferase involved in cell wall biosynthesis
MRRLAVILSGFPRHSETFALNEVRALEAYGILGAAFATKAGDAMPLHPGYEHLYQYVEVLPEGDVKTQAAIITKRLRHTPVAAVHAYFAHTPTEIAINVAKALELPYGFSVHAKDARKIAPEELARRAHGASCVIACNADVARDLEQLEAPVTLMPHGVDLERFSAQPFPELPLQLLAVGRLVPKKGFDVLIRAVAQLSFEFKLRIVGEGPQAASLLALVKAHQLESRVEFCGSLSHAELPAYYAASHLVVVPSVVDAEGDRDGLPNVVLEAMACGRAVIATTAGAISSAVTSGVNGVLVTPNDDTHLAQAINSVQRNPERLATFGGHARLLVERDYDLGKCSQRFCDYLSAAYKLHQPATLPKDLYV